MSGSERWGTQYSDPDDVRGPLWEEAVAAGAAQGAVVPVGAEDAADAEPIAPEGAPGLRRYARWQWRDFWRRRGGWMAGGALLGVWLLVYIAHFQLHRGGATGTVLTQPMAEENVRGMAHVFYTLGGAVAALLGVGGMVSRERERGLQRFLFAKPVQPLAYYLQAFAINSVGSLLVLLGAVLLGTAFLGAAVPVGTVFAVGAGAYLLTAGLTFLASTLIRFDAPIAAAWLLTGFPLVAGGANGIAGARALSWLFPQAPALALVNALGLMQDRGPPSRIVLTGAVVILVCVAYGLLAFLGGVAVLRRRSIST